MTHLCRVSRAGVPIVVGTDQTVPGYGVYREMELYVAGRMSSMEAIEAATIIPARVMKPDRDSGTVEAGKRADLILMDANPLESISNTRTSNLAVLPFAHPVSPFVRPNSHSISDGLRGSRPRGQQMLRRSPCGERQIANFLDAMAGEKTRPWRWCVAKICPAKRFRARLRAEDLTQLMMR
jgi:hypothetical protein